MHILTIDCPQQRKDELIAELWDRGTQGIVEEDQPGGGCRLKAFFDEVVPGLVEEYGGEWSSAEDKDWVTVSRAGWEPLAVGRRFYLVPSWRDDPAPEGRFRIEVEPGQAFGTGLHATTRLALEALEQHVVPGATVLDVGTGTGILAIAAALLGAGRVLACDVDATAAHVAKERAGLAGLDPALFVGSLRSVRSRTLDLLVANINAETIINLAPEIARVLKPGAAAILTGFDADGRDRARASLEPVGLAARTLMDKEGWAAMVV